MNDRFTVVKNDSSGVWYYATPVTSKWPSFLKGVKGANIHQAKKSKTWYSRQDGKSVSLKVEEDKSGFYDGLWLYRETDKGVESVMLISRRDFVNYRICGKDGKSLMPLEQLDLRIYHDFHEETADELTAMRNDLFGIINGLRGATVASA